MQGDKVVITIGLVAKEIKNKLTIETQDVTDEDIKLGGIQYKVELPDGTSGTKTADAETGKIELDIVEVT